MNRRPPLAARRVRGFTILEMVIVLAIIVIMAAASTPAVTGMIRAEQLRAPARELEAMAIMARSRALAEQRPYQITLQRDGFFLERVGRAQDEKILAQYRLPARTDFQLATWPEGRWSTPQGHLWYFAASGLCEPIRVMFRQGEAYFSQSYSAVTGWDQEETFFIP